MNRGYRSMRLVETQLRPWKVSMVLASILVGLVLSAMLLPWQQVATGYGKVVAYSPQDRVQEISAPVEGRLGDWKVGEGARVTRGQVLAQILDNDPEYLNRLGSERHALETRLTAVKTQVETAKINLDRQKTLFDKGLSSRRQYEESVIAYKRLVADEANASAELTRMDVRLSRQKTQQVVSPLDGTILRVLSSRGGQIVKQGQALATIVPDTEARAVELWIHGNDLPLVYPDRKVRLTFEGWPAVQFSGWPSVAVGTFGGKVVLVDATDDGSGKFRVLVVPDPEDAGHPWPKPSYLRQGVRVRGWVLLNQVRLGFEVWRRFNGFPPVQDAPPSAGGAKSK